MDNIIYLGIIFTTVAFLCGYAGYHLGWLAHQRFIEEIWREQDQRDAVTGKDERA